MGLFNKDDDKVSYKDIFIVQHREYGQYFIININGTLPLKAMNHYVVSLKLKLIWYIHYTTISFFLKRMTIIIMRKVC